MPTRSARSTTPKMRPFSLWGKILGALAFLLFSAGLVVAMFLISQGAELRRRAAENDGTIPLRFQAVTVDAEHMRINVSVNTWGYKFAGFDIQGTLVGAPANQVVVESGSQLKFDTVSSSVSTDNNQTQFRLVQFAPLDTNATTGTSGQTMTLFSLLVAKPTNNQVTVSLNPASSVFSFQGSAGALLSFPATQTFTLTPPTSSSDSTNLGGFLIRRYNDLNRNGRQDDNEPGLAGKYQWEKNHDGTWNDYETFTDSNGDGGVVTLADGTAVTIKEQNASGWTPTTAQQTELTVHTNQIVRVAFGVRKATPSPTPSPSSAAVTSTTTSTSTTTVKSSPTPRVSPSPKEVAAVLTVVSTPFPSPILATPTPTPRSVIASSSPRLATPSPKASVRPSSSPATVVATKTTKSPVFTILIVALVLTLLGGIGVYIFFGRR